MLKLGSVIIQDKPTFIKTYDPRIGICIDYILGAKINSTYGREEIIYFSDTINEDEQDELTDIFYQKNPKYSKDYADVFQDLGWKQLSAQSYIFGEIEIKELSVVPNRFK